MANNRPPKKIIQGNMLPASALIAERPDIAALVSKLRLTNNPIEKEMEHSKGMFYSDRGQIEKLSSRIKASVKDNENIMRLFPDMWLAEQILVSSIMSPKDMLHDSLTFKPRETLFPTSVQAELTKLVASHFDNFYKLKEQAPLIISNALFRKGAHIKVILPENILDQVINGETNLANESMKYVFEKDRADTGAPFVRAKGFLGDAPETSNKGRMSAALESAMQSGPEVITYRNMGLSHNGQNVLIDLVDVVDNYDLLKLPKVAERLAQESINRSVMGRPVNNPSSMRSLDQHPGTGLIHKGADKLTHDQFKSIVFKGGNVSNKMMITIPDPDNARRKSVSRPLVLDAPTECCIPVCRPGKPEKPVGAFFLIDIDGNFVTKNSATTHMDSLSAITASNGTTNTLAGGMLQKVNNSMNGPAGEITVDGMSKFFSMVVQNNLIEKLRNGRYHSTLDVSLTQEVSEIMFARVLCDQFTRMVYIPADLFTYFAFEYDDAGVGKSYLDEVKTLTSLRGILLFSKVMGLVKNSINASHVTIKLDPRDPDPDGTIDSSTDLIYRMRQQYFPVDMNSTRELADWVTKAGLEIGFEGHPEVPDVGFNFENRKADHNLPDSDLDDLLRDYTFMRYGITSEMIDGAKQDEFATTVQAKNLLFSRRIRILQSVFCQQATDFIQKAMRFDPVFRSDVMKVLKDNLSAITDGLDEESKKLMSDDADQFLDHFYDMFIRNEEIILPAPDEIKTKTDKELIDAQSEAYDAMIEFFMSNEIAPAETVGEWAGSMDMLKAAYKGYLMRTWATNNNILPEMFELLSQDAEGNPNLNLPEEYKKLFTSMAKSFVDFNKMFKPLAAATAIDMERINNVVSEDEKSTNELDEAGGNPDAIPVPDDVPVEEPPADNLAQGLEE